MIVGIISVSVKGFVLIWVNKETVTSHNGLHFLECHIHLVHSLEGKFARFIGNGAMMCAHAAIMIHSTREFVHLCETFVEYYQISFSLVQVHLDEANTQANQFLNDSFALEHIIHETIGFVALKHFIKQKKMYSLVKDNAPK